METYLQNLTETWYPISYKDYIFIEVMHGTVYFNMPEYSENFYELKGELETGTLKRSHSDRNSNFVINLFTLSGEAVVKITHT